MVEYRSILKRVFFTTLLVFLTSFYLFYVTRIIIHVGNTKNLIAGVGLLLLIYDIAVAKTVQFPKNILWVVICGLAVSLVSYFTMVFNNTSDNTYVLHIRSVIIWISGGYCVCRAIKWYHGKLTFRIVGQYVVGVLMLQCISALLIDNNPIVANFVNRTFYNPGDVAFFRDGGRLYGIGAAIDVAGVRFSAMIIVLGALCVDYAREGNRKGVIIGLCCFGFATMVGNMIARTTTVGVAVCLVYWAFMSLYSFWQGNSIRRLWGMFLLIGLLTYGIGAYEYNHNSKMRENLRFGFEGFFSLVEKGHWETNSNNQLETMIKWPDNEKTWVIGDGYMMDPSKIEPYLQAFHARGEVFYMGTDAGYCRFIFYFGVIGLAIMILLFVVSTLGAMENHPEYKFAMFCILVVNMIVWIKVTTDVYAIIALFLAFRDEEDEEETGEEAS